LRQYIYNIMEIIYNYSRGTAQRNLDMDKIRNLKISIPNLTIQKQIADFCEKNDKLIKQLEEGIEEYKQLAKNIFETFLSIQENKITKQPEQKDQPENQSDEEPKPKKNKKKDIVKNE